MIDLNMPNFFKSTRSILAVVFGLTVSLALFKGLISGEQFMTLAAVVIGAYFGRKDTKSEQGK